MVKSAGRLVSLDIFRGLTVAFMIIVNIPGSGKFVYAQLRHAAWHGCTPADLIFPFFLFIAGISTWFSMKKYGFEINTGSIIRISRRTITIFALGLFFAIFPYFGRDYSTLRIMGILQRIALAYGIGAVICLSVNRNYLWIVIGVVLILYWILLVLFGGAEPYTLEGNIVAKVDAAILGKNHLYKGFGIPFDPEGLLSTIPAVCTVLTGYYAGGITGKGSYKGKTALKILLLGAALTGLGLLWSILLPLNKSLWTSSYVLYTAGFAMGIMSLIYLVSDVLKLRRWGSFFLVFGTNALFTCFLLCVWTLILRSIKFPAGNSEITLYNWIYDKVCIPIAGNMKGSLMFAIIQMLLIWSIVLILYRKRIFIRL